MRRNFYRSTISVLVLTIIFLSVNLWMANYRLHNTEQKLMDRMDAFNQMTVLYRESVKNRDACIYREIHLKESLDSYRAVVRFYNR